MKLFDSFGMNLNCSYFDFYSRFFLQVCSRVMTYEIGEFVKRDKKSLESKCSIQLFMQNPN